MVYNTYGPLYIYLFKNTTERKGEVKMKVDERFLKYVSFHTTSADDSDIIPSTQRQFELARYIENELKNVGISNLIVDDHCYVYGLLPATKGCEDKKPMGFIAHMDTAPDYSGENVKPQIISDYDGKDVVLAGTGHLLKVSDFPELSSFKGRTLITTDGTTLLGADDKAGIAEIVTAMEEIIKEGKPHGDLWIGFTPDEEVGCGADLFDLDYFKADYAYTIDGDYEGEIAYENFNAASAIFRINGVNVHPGSAKNIMKNAASIACEIQSLLPEAQTPEHTQAREGFYHLIEMEGTISEATLSYIVRDHDAHEFQTKLAFLKSIELFINQKYGDETVTLTTRESYHNMLEVIEDNSYIIDLALDAIKKVGLSTVSNPVRGGTDGARLSFMGLPCPNLGTGGYGFHGPFEHITLEGMENAVKIIKEIAYNPIEKI